MTGAWRGRRVLVTGDTGFKGTWLAVWLQQLGATVVGLGLPPDDQRGAYAAIDAASRFEHHDADIRDATATSAVVGAAAPDVVFHLAAQALVRRGYADPALTYATNVVGTANVLDAVATAPSVGAVVVVTSDKVYRQDGAERRFRETDELGGNDPYSASKACTELVVSEWRRRTPHIAAATARAGNVIGGGDRGQDRLLPDVVRSIEASAPVSVRNPSATRPWQHVLDALSGYVALADALLAGGEVPPALNFGPNESAPVDAVLDAFIEHLGAGSWELADGEHPHEEARLALDVELAGTALGWRPRLDLATALGWTAEWYRAQLDAADVATLTLEQIERFEALRVTVWLNGELVADGDASVSTLDHGLTVGDGVFETMIIRRGVAFARRRHLDRLERSLAGLGLPVPDRAVLEQACEEIAAAAGLADGRLRLTVTGGVGPPGSGRGDGPCTVLAMVTPLDPLPPTADVITVPWTRNENSPLAGLKTTSYGENVVALARAREAGAHEAIFANTRGELCEGTGTNIAVVIGGRLVTPPLSSGCLAGVTRALAIEHCGISEETVPFAALADITEACLLGTTRDVQPISSIDGRALDTGDLTRAARDSFAALVARDLDP